MFSLFKKEIKIFLGSLIGYLVVIVFLLVTSLFLWVFPGPYNIPDNDYATLQGLFSLAPWLYLFLIPAITMRFFADEKRTGTLEILLTHPISDLKLVLAKFFAGLFLVILSLLPTLLYFLSVYLLGNPVGSIDVGATWGSFIGLFFLAAIYIAIGVFASSRTDNQIVAFILAMAMSFIFYIGFDFIATAGVSYLLEQLFSWLSIETHYQSISRGVVDMRDIIYFLGMAMAFLFLTAKLLRKGNRKNRKTKKVILVFFTSLIFLFYASTFFLYRLDLTADKRYSLSNVSAEIASQIDRPVEVELFLAGEMEPGLRQLQKEVIEKIAVLNVYAQKPIRVKVTDPYAFANAERSNEFQSGLVRRGIIPMSFNLTTEEGVSTKYIFPGAIVRMGTREIAINLLQNNADFSAAVNFNHSMESVEFELVNAFRRLMRTNRSVLAFLEGHGEFNTWELRDFTNALGDEFMTKRIVATQLNSSEVPDILIVAGPTQPFTENEKLAIDQYIMQGGKVVWLIDPVQVSLDSLSNGYQTFAFPRDLNLNDQLFKYGVRLNYELLQDIVCAEIRVNVAPAGSNPQWQTFPWYYSPLLIPSDNHPMSRNLNKIYTEFVSSIDTVSGSGEVHKSIILTTSPYARSVNSPSSVSLQNINNPPARELFNESNIPVGVLLEGKFPSVFENRVIDNFGISQQTYVAKSKPTKMVVIADAGLIANKVNYSTQPPQISELGRDRVANITHGNKEFLLNMIYYLNDDSGIMQLRSRSFELRLLDKVKLREEKARWQWINVLVPILLIMLIGVAYNVVRKYRYNRS